jgi:uncharacterized protein RhaS with RHS repeats
MRARYYESASGRFISEDPDGQGGNWFTYCGNNPVGNVDSSGKSIDGVAQSVWMLIAFTCFILSMVFMNRQDVGVGTAFAFAGCSATYNAVGWNPKTPSWFKAACQGLNFFSTVLSIAAMIYGTAQDKRTAAIGIALGFYVAILLACLIDCYILPGDEVWASK